MATYLGVLLGLAWKVALVFAVVWLAIAFLLRYSSLAALIATLAVPIVLYLHGRRLTSPSLFAVMSRDHLDQSTAPTLRAWSPAPNRASDQKGDQTARPRLTDRQRLAWLRLIRTPNVGPATFRDLINRFGSAEAAIEQLPELMRNAGSALPRAYRRWRRRKPRWRRRRATAPVSSASANPIIRRMLRRMDYPPPLLAVKGNGRGVHAAGGGDRRRAQCLARRHENGANAGGALGKEGYAVISGLARGIDTAAHEGSLATGTVGGSGRRPRPPLSAGKRRPLRTRSAEAAARSYRKCRSAGSRARRIFRAATALWPGLALGLVVVEAAQRSGSLISARLAGEMGRVVFAVPGSPLDPRAEGTNGLLKEGAILVTGAEDILEAIAPLTASSSAPADLVRGTAGLSDYAAAGRDATAQRVIEALGPVPTGVDEIIRHTGLHPAQVFMILLELDLAGRLERHSGGAVSLVYPT